MSYRSPPQALAVTLMASLLGSPMGASAQERAVAAAPAASAVSATPVPNVQEVRPIQGPGPADQSLPARGSRTARATAVREPYAPIKRPPDDEQIAEIDMYVGESRVFPTPGVARIAVGNGGILTAAALDGREVILFANGEGTSSLFVWSADGRYQRVKINIGAGATGRSAREVSGFLRQIPNARTSIIGEKVIVEGEGISDSDLAKIGEIAKVYPQVVNLTNRLGLEQMVMMDVKVVEFPVNELREYGLKWGATGGAAVGGIWAPYSRITSGPYQMGVENSPITRGDGGTGGVPLPTGLNVLTAMNMGLSARLNLLAQDGKAAILAEPQLTARNGAKASFLAGGEIPYSVSSLAGTSILFKPYGIKLDITPRVDRNGIIRATISSEVSAIDTSVPTLGGPALSTRKTATEFNVRSGETMVLGGVLSRKTSGSVDKIPLLGDIPVLGALFRSKRFQNDETELVVFVTPTLVDSASPGLVDRIERTGERLQERMGPRPYLSDPVQPGRNMGRPDQAPAPVPAVPPAPTSQAPVPVPAPAAAPVVATPPVPSVAAVAPVATSPAMPATASTVVPASPVSAATTLGATTSPLSYPPGTLPTQRLRVAENELELHADADVTTPVLRRLPRGTVVDRMPGLPRGDWLPVRFRWQQIVVLGWVPGAALKPL